MQIALSLGAREDIEWVRDQLETRFGCPAPILARTPIGQLVKSSISGRTRDEISLAAYGRLLDAFPRWSDITRASTTDIETVIRDVTFPDVKARHLHDALCAVAAGHPDFDLAFLGSLSVENALEWLERLPGVGRKVAASTLNFSMLHMPTFVVDTHILRISRRFGFVRKKADTRAAYDMTMAVLHDWSATDLATLHILMKRLGQTVCQADRASCRHCPIRLRCQAAAGVG